MFLFAVFICILSITVTQGTNCPSGTIAPGNGVKDNICYLFVVDSKSAYDAENYCKDHGGHLIKIDSENLNNDLGQKVLQYLPGVLDFWTGGIVVTDSTNNQNVWVWTQDDSIMLYTDWHQSPTTTTGRCASYGTPTDSWTSRDCQQTISFVCGIPSSGGPPSSSCDSEWTYFPKTGKCYVRMISGGGDFSTAEKACNKYGAHIASIHSSEENHFVVTLSGSDKAVPQAWIGLKEDGSGNVYWTDGSAVDYLNFNSGNDDIHDWHNSCFAFEAFTKKWRAATCDEEHQNVVCKK